MCLINDYTYIICACTFIFGNVQHTVNLEIFVKIFLLKTFCRNDTSTCVNNEYAFQFRDFSFRSSY